ncbi:DNA-binding protein [Arthrobacter citreus]|nr:DNA-binding protein [Arthrobacter citreus]
MLEKADLPQVLRAEDIAKYLRISSRRAYEIFDVVGFPKMLIGRSKRVEREKFLDWLDEQNHIDVK